jgi:Family of unknown function (DUF6236)
MPTFTGLYYPFIHFKDEGWLKASALYWDGMKRMVPAQVALHDSDEIKVLEDAGYVQNESPERVLASVAAPFLGLIRQHGERLAATYGVQHREAWPADQYTRTHAPKGADPRLAYVFGEKLGHNLLSDLYACDLVTSRSDDPRWIGMHPRLADLYMTVLAERLAVAVGAHPLAEETIDHVAVGAGTVEEMAAVLLDDPELIVVDGGRRLEESMCALAFQYAVPVNPSEVTATTIVKFRQDFTEERGLFQAEVSRLVAEVDHLEMVSDPDEVHRQLTNEFNKTLGPAVDRIRTELRANGIDTVESALGTSFGIPAGLALVLQALGVASAAMAPAGIAFAGWTLWRHWRKGRSKALGPSAAAYLYQAGQQLRPDDLARKIQATSVAVGASELGQGELGST